jgi:hypothetical protein
MYRTRYLAAVCGIGARVEEGEGDVRDALLRADQRVDLGERIERHAEPTLHPRRDRLP